MMMAARQSRLREILARRGMSDLDTLVREMGVSQSTVRRDLELLERDGLARRTHGGAVWIGDKTAGTRPYAFDQRMGYQTDAKRRIVRAAAGLVDPGQTILIDGGTTTYFLAQELIGRALQIVTNSLPIAELFLNDENVELILTGGLAYPRYGVLLGPIAENVIDEIHAKTLFLSAAGIHDSSLYNQNLLLVQAEQKMMRQAQEVVLLADSGKFGQQALARLCGLDEIDVVVTDDGISTEQRKLIERAGCRLIVAP